MFARPKILGFPVQFGLICFEPVFHYGVYRTTRRVANKTDGTACPKRVDGVVASKHILPSRRMEKRLIAMIISMIIGAHLPRIRNQRMSKFGRGSW